MKSGDGSEPEVDPGPSLLSAFSPGEIALGSSQLILWTLDILPVVNLVYVPSFLLSMPEILQPFVILAGKCNITSG